MLKINRQVEYGLVAIKYMRGKPPAELTTVREICQKFGTPFDPVANVMRTLNAKGVIRSEQGSQGGYRLAGDLSQIHLGEFIAMVDGDLAFVDCLRNPNRRCKLTESCNIVAPLTFVDREIQRLLMGISVEKLVDPSTPWDDLLAV
ncbi:MAG: Rrf2 family transcriptional regulator [Deltaproteobacteria bacterium]|nr:Rrf2 family transcriptional regulator [Deltaproteobacteria bacterium]